METVNEKTGQELIFLLKQQRNLYHQLRDLAEKQTKTFWSTTSPEDLVRILAGRRKLLEKLREVNSKLKSIKNNWPILQQKINVQEKVQARSLAVAVAQLVNDLRQIQSGKEQSTDVLSDTAQLAHEFAQE